MNIVGYVTDETGVIHQIEVRKLQNFNVPYRFFYKVGTYRTCLYNKVYERY